MGERVSGLLKLLWYVYNFDATESTNAFLARVTISNKTYLVLFTM